MNIKLNILKLYILGNTKQTRKEKDMAYVKCEPRYKKKAKFKVGDWAVTRKKIKAEAGYFEKGTRVKK